MLANLLLAAGLAASGPGDVGGGPALQKYGPLPGEVRAFIERRVECNHWTGEDPYDAERAKQIADAVRALRCERIEAEERALRRRHARSPAVLRALTETRDDTL